jgi:hypothetical protein
MKRNWSQYGAWQTKIVGVQNTLRRSWMLLRERIAMSDNSNNKYQYEMDSEMREACENIADSELELADVAQALLEDLNRKLVSEIATANSTPFVLS